MVRFNQNGSNAIQDPISQILTYKKRGLFGVGLHDTIVGKRQKPRKKKRSIYKVDPMSLSP